MADTHTPTRTQTGSLIGQRVPRREDARHLSGNAAFIADITAPDCLEVAFVRSPVAHGVLKGLDIGPDVPPAMVRHAGHIGHLLPMRGDLLRDGFNGAPWPLLATGKVRFVGEAIAMVMAPTRAQAEEWAAQVTPRIDPLPAVVSVREEFEHPTVPLHGNLQSNLIMHGKRSHGDFDRIVAQAQERGLRQVRRRFTMDRILASPLETRGALALRDKASGAIHLHLSTQRPHLLRSFVAELIPELHENDLRIIVPDVGGGFGSKSNLYPEEVLLAWLAMDVGRPVRWIEDRYEHFVASNHSRQHDQEIAAWVDAQGRIHALSAVFIVDGGAYCAKSSTGAIEANMAANMMTGPYDIRDYHWESISLYSNKSPMGPYRGVGRTGGCFAMERIIEEVAHELGLDAMQVRRRNLIPASAMPYTTATGLAYDSGNYLEAVDAADAYVREHWADRAAAPGRRAGHGFAMLVEQAGHGTTEWHRRGSPTVYGHEAARVTLNNDGTLEVDVGTLGHGQGHATSYAQIAADLTSLPLELIRVRQGDTAATPYGNGTVASRSIVMGGGAVAQGCRRLMAKARRIAAANLDGAEPESLRLQGGALHGPQGAITLAEIARIATVQLHKLPKDIEPVMSIQAFYRPEVETGTFSYAMHAARVEVDLATGFVSLTDYLVVEDCGTVVNPLIVDGQIIGGVAQGIGQALYESMRYNADGQPETVTFGDYLVPSALEVPNLHIIHLDTPSPFSAFGVKGMGEGGSVPPPAAIANAVRRALLDLGVAVNATPIRPDDLLEQLMAAGNEGRA